MAKIKNYKQEESHRKGTILFWIIGLLDYKYIYTIHKQPGSPR